MVGIAGLNPPYGFIETAMRLLVTLSGSEGSRSKERFFASA